MQRTTVRVGTAREFFERGRNYAKRARLGQRLPVSRLITFEDPADMMRVLSPAKLQLLRAVKTHPGSIGSLASRLGRDRSAVTREVAQLKRFGLVSSSCSRGSWPILLTANICTICSREPGAAWRIPGKSSCVAACRR